MLSLPVDLRNHVALFRGRAWWLRIAGPRQLIVDA